MTGRPYIGHPLEVLNILNGMEADYNLMATGKMFRNLISLKSEYVESGSKKAEKAM